MVTFVVVVVVVVVVVFVLLCFVLFNLKAFCLVVERRRTRMPR